MLLVSGSSLAALAGRAALEALAWVSMAIGLPCYHAVAITQCRARPSWRLRPRPALARRPDPGRGLRVQPLMDEDPGGWPLARQPGGPRFGQPAACMAPCRLSGQRFQMIGRPVKNRNGNYMKQFLPIPPCGQLDQIVGTHEPDEADAGKVPDQGLEGLHGVDGPERGLDGSRQDSGVPGAGPGVGQALGQGRGAPARLQGVLGRDQPPDPVQPEPPQGLARDFQVPLVGRVEGAAEEPDALPPPRQGPAQGGSQPGAAGQPGAGSLRGSAEGGDRGAPQGRTCPDPRTRYL